MAVTYLFLAQFTKVKACATPSERVTIDIADAGDPVAALLVSAGSPTELTNMPGVFAYAFVTGTPTHRPVGMFRTTDPDVDLMDIPSYPQIILDENNNVLAAQDGVAAMLENYARRDDVAFSAGPGWVDY